jgi:protease-4
MTNARFGCLGIGLVVLLAVSLLLNLIFFVANSATTSTSLLPDSVPKFSESVVQPGKNTDERIALIYLRGIITGAEPGTLGETAVDDLKMQLKQAGDDSKIRAVVLHIDSPGGEVTASDTIYNAVRRLREKKPVVVYMGSLAASGGYYVACGGNWLIANETTFTGSIGVIMQTLNYQQLIDKVGLQVHTFKSGKFKDMLSGSRPITPEEEQYVNGLVMQTYGKFVGIVAKERNLPEDQLRNGVADGRVVSGKDALDAKLVNQLGEVEDAYVKAMELAKVPNATVVRYDTPFALAKIFRMLGKSEGKASIEVNLADSLRPKLEAGRLYYLPSHFAL